MNPLAEQMNHNLKSSNIHVYDMLSTIGKEIYFPKEGILNQSAEAAAKATKFNATIGIATENGTAMYLNAIQETLSSYHPNDLYPYAPPAGKPALRKLWATKMLKENPSLEGKAFSHPIVTNATR